MIKIDNTNQFWKPKDKVHTWVFDDMRFQAEYDSEGNFVVNFEGVYSSWYKRNNSIFEKDKNYEHIAGLLGVPTKVKAIPIFGQNSSNITAVEKSNLEFLDQLLFDNSIILEFLGFKKNEPDIVVGRQISNTNIVSEYHYTRIKPNSEEVAKRIGR